MNCTHEPRCDMGNPMSNEPYPPCHTEALACPFCGTAPSRCATCRNGDRSWACGTCIPVTTWRSWRCRLQAVLHPRRHRGVNRGR